MNKVSLLSAALTGVLCLPVTAWGQAPAAAPAASQRNQPAEGDIIVTATRQVTTLQHTPIAVSVFSQQQLDRQQVVNAADIQRFVPSLQFNQQADNGAVLLTLRGIGNDSAFTDAADPEVAIYVDGIYSPRAQGGTALLYDLDRIEVLRGPQGTLFGRNTTAGALSLITAKPKLGQFSGNAEVIGGDYKRFGTRAAVNIPISDTLAVRLAFASEQHDGYAKYQEAPNLPGIDKSLFLRSGKRYYAQDQKSGRISLLWQPSDKFRWNINAETFWDKGAPAAPLMQTPRPGQKMWSLLADSAPDNDRYASSIRSTMDYEFSDTLEASYIAGFNRVGGTSQSEADFGVLPILTTTGGFYPYASEQNETVHKKATFFSHELQLKSHGEQAVTWIIGAFYAHENNTSRFDIDDRDGYRGGPSSFSVSFIQNPGYKVDSYAGFGQATWNLSQRFRLTGGLRYSIDKKTNLGGNAVYLFGCPTPPTPGAPLCRGIEGQYPGTTADQLAALLGPDFVNIPNQARGTFKKMTYLARADYDVSDDILAYGSISTGFKSGIIDDLGRGTGPETLTSYELGLKSKWFDRKLTLNLAGFYYDFKGYQVGQIEVIRDANGNIISSSVRTLNADGATVYGLEAEATFNPTPQDHFQLATAYQKSSLRSLVTLDQRFDGDPSDLTAQQQLKGNDLPHLPRFSATLTYEHDFLLGNGAKITPRGTIHYETASYLSIFNGDRTNRIVNGQQVYYGTAFDKQKAYTRSDIAIRYTAPENKYVLEAFMQNVENKKIRTSATTYGLAADANGFLSLLQPPRTYGARFKVSF